MEETQKPITEKELFSKLQAVYAEMLTLEDDAKSLKESGKEAELDVALISSLAKAAAKGKLGEVLEKSEATIEMIGTLT